MATCACACTSLGLRHKSWVSLTTPEDKGGKIREPEAHRGGREDTGRRRREGLEEEGEKEENWTGKKEGRRPWGQKQLGTGWVREEEGKGRRRMGGKERRGGWAKEKGR